jgi:4-hydroxybenzoate polyprenyltransferase
MRSRLAGAMLRSAREVSTTLMMVRTAGCTSRLAVLPCPLTAADAAPAPPAGHVEGCPMNVTLFAHPRSLAVDVVQLWRPNQWAKNIYIFAPLLFSRAVLNPAALIAALVACGCFCLWSSAIYCINDVLDATADRKHPRKRERPVAAGRLHPSFAVSLSLGLISTATLLAVVLLPTPFLLISGLFLANGFAYSIYLKHRVIIDVLSIALGFVLRIIAGCYAIGLQPTSWLLVCGFSLALLLGFGKRCLEVTSIEHADEYRSTLLSYNTDKLNLLLGITSSLCLMSYMLYTVSPQTLQLHGTDALIYSVPFVAYGIFRYLFKVQEGGYDGPDELLLQDAIFIINGALWLLTVIGILYFCSSR